MNRIGDPFQAMEAITAALEKITNNPDGGTLTIKGDDGKNIIFTMPPLAQRTPLSAKGATKMIKKLMKINTVKEEKV